MPEPVPGNNRANLSSETESAWLDGGGSGVAVSAVGPPDDGLGLLVYDEQDNEVVVPILREEVLPAKFQGTLRQRFDNQRGVALTLVCGGALVGRLALPLPSRPRGEPVIATLICERRGHVQVTLEHGDESVRQSFTY